MRSQDLLDLAIIRQTDKQGVYEVTIYDKSARLTRAAILNRQSFIDAWWARHRIPLELPHRNYNNWAERLLAKMTQKESNPLHPLVTAALDDATDLTFDREDLFRGKVIIYNDSLAVSSPHLTERLGGSVSAHDTTETLRKLGWRLTTIWHEGTSKGVWVRKLRPDEFYFMRSAPPRPRRGRKPKVREEAREEAREEVPVPAPTPPASEDGIVVLDDLVFL